MCNEFDICYSCLSVLKVLSRSLFLLVISKDVYTHRNRFKWTVENINKIIFMLNLVMIACATLIQMLPNRCSLHLLHRGPAAKALLFVLTALTVSLDVCAIILIVRGHIRHLKDREVILDYQSYGIN